MNKAVFAAVAATLLLGGCNQAAQAPEMTAQQLMAKEVQPTAEIYWNAVQFISDEKGDHDIFPKTDAEWKAVQDAAVKLGKLGAQLKEPGFSEGRGQDWVQFSDSLIEVSKLAEQAAAERNTDKVFEVGGTIYSVCSACHQMYPPATGPGTEARPGDDAA
ncbi:MAG: hypothetical protein J7493_10825 [Porphyrobacter sp.]|nr:hypothetical protein [Porphyrobacter sp.]